MKTGELAWLLGALSLALSLSGCETAYCAEQSYDRYDVAGMNAVYSRAMEIGGAYSNEDIPHVDRPAVLVPEIPRTRTDGERQVDFNNCVHNITRQRAYRALVDEWKSNDRAKAVAWQEGLAECQDRADTLEEEP